MTGGCSRRNWVPASDPSLVRRNRPVAGRRLESPEEADSLASPPGASPYVAGRLSTLAPRLAPENFVSFANEQHYLAREGSSGVSWPWRRSEDGVGSDPPPDDVRLAGYSFFPVTEGRPTVVIPRHLENTRMGGHPLDAQARSERPVRGRQVGHEGFHDHLAEQGLLLRGEILPVPLETRKRLKRRRQASAAPSASRWANISSADSRTVPRPTAMSSSASRSPASHCGVKNHA